MEKRDKLLKKIGFYKIIDILPDNGKSMKLRDFYVKLYNEHSYDKTFDRIKDTLITKEVIEIYYGKTNRTKYIKLTRKGMTIKQILNALLELIE